MVDMENEAVTPLIVMNGESSPQPCRKLQRILD